jgi:hypothetical protein
MKPENVTHNMECQSDSHTHHLCYMVSQGLHLEDGDFFQTLTKAPQFNCERCGRVAHSEQNLCKPVRL